MWQWEASGDPYVVGDGLDGEVEAASAEEALRLAVADCKAELRGAGCWSPEGEALQASLTLYDGDGDEAGEEWVTVDIPPDHDALMRGAGADPDCDHEWTAEGEGGCSENPGVWATGGTSLTICTHCAHCGLHRTEHLTGSQRNPGETDTVVYEADS